MSSLASLAPLPPLIQTSQHSHNPIEEEEEKQQQNQPQPKLTEEETVLLSNLLESPPKPQTQNNETNGEDYHTLKLDDLLHSTYGGDYLQTKVTSLNKTIKDLNMSEQQDLEETVIPLVEAVLGRDEKLPAVPSARGLEGVLLPPGVPTKDGGGGNCGGVTSANTIRAHQLLCEVSSMGVWSLEGGGEEDRGGGVGLDGIYEDFGWAGKVVEEVERVGMIDDELFGFKNDGGSGKEVNLSN